MYIEQLDPSKFSELEQKVVVVSGGASGIGAALVEHLYEHGAHVVFGDINSHSGEDLRHMLLSRPSGRGSLSFVSCDVSKYEDNYKLFRKSLDLHGMVDHAVSCAGIVDSAISSYFDASLDVDSVGKDPGNKSTLDVNFIGTCHFARIALVFLRHNRVQNPENDKSLTFLSSVTGFRDAPGMFLYQVSV